MSAEVLASCLAGGSSDLGVSVGVRRGRRHRSGRSYQRWSCGESHHGRVLLHPVARVGRTFGHRLSTRSRKWACFTWNRLRLSIGATSTAELGAVHWPSRSHCAAARQPWARCSHVRLPRLSRVTVRTTGRRYGGGRSFLPTSAARSGEWGLRESCRGVTWSPCAFPPMARDAGYAECFTWNTPTVGWG